MTWAEDLAATVLLFVGVLLIVVIVWEWIEGRRNPPA
jgi:hypothetical protein